LKVKTPEPVPLLGSVTHGLFELAVHAHAAELIVNVTLPEPPAPSMEAPLVERLAVQPFACVNATACPATVSEPERDGPALAATLYVTVALPLPLVGETASHESLLAAVHGHEGLLAVMPMLPEPAAADGVRLVGVTLKVQPLP
jgi:hypothetical protein